MSPEPRFTILIPTRNRGHYLAGALESALRQSFDNFEIVVSNNNSRDDTEAVVRRLADSRVRLVNPGRDLSMSGHWEFALQQARGEYVLLLCDDDAFSPTLLPTIHAHLSRASSDIVMWNASAYWHWDHPDPAEHGIARFWPVTGAAFALEPGRLLAHAFALGSTQYLPRMLNSCTRRSVLEQARSAAGSLFWGTCPDFSSAVLQLSFARSAAFLDLPLAVWGVGKDSIGRSSGDQSAALHEHLRMTGSPLTRVPCRKPNTALNHIVESYLLAQEQLPSRLRNYEIDWGTYFRRLRFEVSQMGARGVDVAELLTEIDDQERSYRLRAGGSGTSPREHRSQARLHDWVLARFPPAWQIRLRTGARPVGQYKTITEFAAAAPRFQTSTLGLHDRYILRHRRKMLEFLGTGARSYR